MMEQRGVGEMGRGPRSEEEWSGMTLFRVKKTEVRKILRLVHLSMNLHCKGTSEG